MIYFGYKDQSNRDDDEKYFEAVQNEAVSLSGGGQHIKHSAVGHLSG